MTNRSNRRAIAIAAIVILVVAAVGIGVYWLGRPTVTPPPTISPTTVPTATGPTPTYAPTDQYGSPEPGLAAGPAIAGQGGTETGPAGLPLGYTHDETGAVNAATNYLGWMNSIRITDKATADAMATSSAVDRSTATALISSFDQVRSGMTDLTSDQPEPARGAYAVPIYSPDRALIYIWAPEVTTSKDGQTDHLWAIDAIPLVWASGDWKLDRALIAKTGGTAVDPSNPAGNPTSEEKHSILTRVPADPGAITDSADQTWLEYANAPH